MPVLASEAFGLNHDTFSATGAFDRFLDLDALLYVDPHLLEASSAPELEGSYERFQKHFEGILALIRTSKRHGDVLWKTARHRLTFREVPGFGLGFSKSKDTGSAVGEGLAEGLLATAADLIRAGCEDPVVFELAGVLQEDFGPDRISDMTISIILPHLLRYTERIARNLGIPPERRFIRGIAAEVPINPLTDKPLLLVPQDILRDLPVAESWTDIDHVAAHNDELRARVNETIGETWKNATTNVKKEDLREVLLREPELVEDILRQYKAKPSEAYDFDRDPAGEIRWYMEAKKAAERFPLDLRVPEVNCDNVHEVVLAICRHFRKLIEDNALYELLYAPDGKPLKERAVQRLFYGIADVYCKAVNLDLTAESNGGRGPVDFKISSGYTCRVNVEAKLSTNNLVKGFKKQLPIYDAAEQAYASILLVVRVQDSTTNIDNLKKARAERINEGGRCPDVFIVDGRPQPSASKAA